MWSCTTTGSGWTARSNCEFLCGNNYLDTSVNEPCDRMCRPYTHQTYQGYTAQDSSWVENDVTYTCINIGCSKYCEIETNFVCPADNTYSTLMCSDRCHDGEYDGPYVAMDRAVAQRSWPYRSNSALSGTTRKSNTADAED